MNCSAAWFIFGKRGDSMKKGALTNGLIGAIFIAVVSIALVLGLSRMDAAHTEASADAAGPYTPGTYTASADGFGGPVEVTVEVGKNGGITDITIKGDGETPEIGGAAIPELKKLALAAQSADIDVVTGASLTSGAVKTALSDALVQAGGKPVAVEAQAESAAAEGEAQAESGAAEVKAESAAAEGETQAESGAAEVKAESAAAEGEAQAENAAAEGEAQAEAGEEADVAAGSADAVLTPGTYTASADGFGGPVEVTVEVGSDGSIADVSIIGESETPEIGGAAIPELKKAALASQSADIDSVSGASLTSGAVKAALADALAQAAGGAGAADAQADGNEESGAAKAADGKKFIAGTYTATATGFGGDIDVTVTVTEDEITDVEITGDHETENIGSFAVDMLGDRILEAQSPNVDALTGATVTSKAIIRALKDALTEAGADLDAFPKPEDAEPELMEYEDLSTDIVIIGAGGAGMTAAIKAAQGGKDVILLEKMPYAGGNTTKATGGMNAAETHYQAEQGIEDSVEQFIEDTMKGGHDINDIDLVTVMAENSAEGIDWLDSIGAPLPKVSFSGGATNPRIHAPEDGSGVGAYLVTAFLKKLDELGVKVMYDTEATSLITFEGTVVGVQAVSPTTFYTIGADAVILATGGFGNNEDMIVRYRDDLKGTVTTSAPGITGDGILMAEAVGADLVDIDQIQLHPTVEQGTSMLITESVRGDGAILVNQDGKRFTNELLTRDVVSAAELEQPGSYAYIIFDQRLRDGLKAIEKYVSTGITKQADTIEGLAEQLDIDPATLADTLATWNKYVADQNDPDFGRDTGMENDLSVAPFYAIKIAPGIHHTMGGVRIDTSARVIDTEGNVIPGLFAAGEVTGGVHGGNRIGGNAVADIVVFGTVASESAMAYCDEKNVPAVLTPGTYTASAEGFGGAVDVTVEVGSDGSIADVSIIGESETPEIGGAAIPELQAAALAAGSADIDSVSGATFTSGAVKAALSDALAQAAGGAGAADAQADDSEAADAPKAADGKKFIAGTYTATSTGFGGDIDVTVTVTEDEITDVEITGDHETENIGSFAVDMLGDRILEAQSPNVDALTGATVTSKAIIKALKDALTEAGADLDSFPNPEDAEPELMKFEDLSTDIVIIGAGGAGMTAAIKAAQAGKDVILLEKMPYAGGNTTKATGGMNAAETHYQAEQGIEDSVEQFIEDTMKGGHDINDIDLVTAMAENSAEGIDWLDSIGAPLPKVSFSGGATNPRIHAPEDGSGVGAYLVTAFLKKLDELNVNIMYDTKATNLITLEGAVIGVQAESPTTFYTIYADAVILATGGFGNNEDMIVEYRDDLKGTVTTSAPGITGDGILMAEAVGADLVDIDQIQLHPTVEQGTSMLITESVRGDGAILVNQDGKRFTNELLTRDVVSAAELEQPGSYAYIIFDQRLRDGLKAIEKYVSTGITKQADTIEGLAEQLEIDPATLAETLATWNKYVADQNDPDFGRDTGMENDLSVAPYYAIKIAPGIHHTMGGVHIDTDARVIDTNGNVIPGLFAAGEVTGGVHGGNRIGGNAVADIVVFGTIASESAIAYCDEKAGEAEEVAGALADEAAEALEDEAAEALAGEAAEALEEEAAAAVAEEAAAAVAEEAAAAVAEEAAAAVTEEAAAAVAEEAAAAVTEEAAAAVAEEAAADSAAVSTAVPAESAAESAAAPAVESAAPAASTASTVESAAEPAPAQAA